MMYTYNWYLLKICTQKTTNGRIIGRITTSFMEDFNDFKPAMSFHVTDGIPFKIYKMNN